MTSALVACTDLKPLEAEVSSLKSQVVRLQSESEAIRKSADDAASAAHSASQVAAGAQSTANQAMAGAQSSQACCDATNEKIDRMFKRALVK
jgi:hypothetical protein